MEEIHFSHRHIIRLQSTTTPGGATRCLGVILSRAQDRKSLGHFRMARVLGAVSIAVKL